MGEPCVLGNAASCSGQLLCEAGATPTDPATCGTGVGTGLSCSAEHPCALGGRCAGGKCGLVVKPLGTCNSDAQCPAGTFCATEGCEPKPVLGEECDESAGARPRRECIEGICVDGVCTLGAGLGGVPLRARAAVLGVRRLLREHRHVRLDEEDLGPRLCGRLRVRRRAVLHGPRSRDAGRAHLRAPGVRVRQRGSTPRAADCSRAPNPELEVRRSSLRSSARARPRLPAGGSCPTCRRPSRWSARIDVGPEGPTGGGSSVPACGGLPPLASNRVRRRDPASRPASPPSTIASGQSPVGSARAVRSWSRPRKGPRARRKGRAGRRGARAKC